MTTHNPSKLSRRTAQLVLALLLVFFLAWDMRAVLLDNRPGATLSDNTVTDVNDLRETVRHEGLGAWVLKGSVKGPLAAMLISALTPLVGDLLIAARLLSVILHLFLLWIVFGLTARLTRRVEGGLLAVVICGTFPMEYGWFRLDFHDPLVALAVPLTLWALMGDLQRRWSAVRLGVVVGLGSLTKLSYPIFVVIPGLWFLATRLRRGRHAAHLGLAAVIALVLLGWWLIPSWEGIMENLNDSSRTEGIRWIDVFGSYFGGLPGVTPMILAALAGAAVAAWRRLLSVDQLVLLLSSLVGALVALIFFFDSWSRYLLPLFPVASVLAACGLVALGQWLRGRWAAFPARAAACGLATVLLAQYCYFNVVDLPSAAEDREFHLGMVAPDQRLYDGLPSAVETIRRLKLAVVEMDSPSAVWTDRGYRLKLLHQWQAQELLDRGRKVGFLLIHEHDDAYRALVRHLGTGAERDAKDLAKVFNARATLDPGAVAHRKWMAAMKTRLVKTWIDPDGMKYSVFQIWEPDKPGSSSRR